MKKITLSFMLIFFSMFSEAGIEDEFRKQEKTKSELKKTTESIIMRSIMIHCYDDSIRFGVLNQVINGKENLYVFLLDDSGLYDSKKVWNATFRTEDKTQETQILWKWKFLDHQFIINDKKFPEVTLYRKNNLNKEIQKETCNLVSALGEKITDQHPLMQNDTAALKPNSAQQAKSTATSDAKRYKNQSLCEATEDIIFSCSTGKKLISICSNKDFDLDTGYLQYRFGTQDKIELTYPTEPINPKNKFKVNYLKPMNDDGSRSIIFELGFTIGKFGYDLEYFENRKSSAQLAVTNTGKTVAKLNCHPESINSDNLYKMMQF